MSQKAGRSGASTSKYYSTPAARATSQEHTPGGGALQDAHRWRAFFGAQATGAQGTGPRGTFPAVARHRAQFSIYGFARSTVALLAVATLLLGVTLLGLPIAALLLVVAALHLLAVAALHLLAASRLGAIILAREDCPLGIIAVHANLIAVGDALFLTLVQSVPLAALLAP